MSKTIDRYFIRRLEDTERNLRHEEARNLSICDDMKETRNKLQTLANLFDITKSTDGTRSYYKLKSSCLISEDEEAYKIIDELLKPEIEIPF